MTVLALNATACNANELPHESASITVILATATGNEPEAHLKPALRTDLKNAALAGGAAVVLALPGARLVPIPLTPRRPSGAVDYGPTRTARAEHLIDELDATLAAAASTAAQLDLLTPVNTIVGLAPSNKTDRLIIISSGLSSADPIDLNVIGWQQDPQSLAANLQTRHLLADWSRWHVTFSGLGETAGKQRPLPESARQQLIGYWLAICLAAHALSCDSDDEPAVTNAPAHGRAVTTVAVPKITTRHGPTGTAETDVPDQLLFTLNSATLLRGADDVLKPIASALRRGGRRVCIIGMTDSITGEPAYNRHLSQQRAEAVERALLRDGLPRKQIVCVKGVGSSLNAPGADLTDGEPDLRKAAALRRVVITFLI